MKGMDVSTLHRKALPKVHSKLGLQVLVMKVPFMTMGKGSLELKTKQPWGCINEKLYASTEGQLHVEGHLSGTQGLGLS